MPDELLDRLFGANRLEPYHDRYSFTPTSAVVQKGRYHTVLRVTDLTQELPVTLKVYDFSETTQGTRDLIETMWQSEVRVLMQLIPYQFRRPGLVRFVEGGSDTATGTSFVCWENTYRATLAKLLQAPDFVPDHLQELGTKVDLMVMLVEALFELHSHGIIHREINPDAISIWPDHPSRAAFTQFGMSVFLNNFLWADAPDRFAADAQFEAMAYWAPERLAFLTNGGAFVQPGEDYRQDFFSLGLAMTEWFTRPFEPDSVRAFLDPESGYDDAAHQSWLYGEVFPRIYETRLTNDEPSEDALKKLLFDMVQFHPDDRVPTAGQLVRAARDVRAHWRERGYRKLCQEPFAILCDAGKCAENLDIGSPREQRRTDLPREELVTAVSEELQRDLTDAHLQIGFVTGNDRYAEDRYGTPRWFLRGRENLYRLERFRSKLHHDTECPWVAYLHQIVRGSTSVENLTTVPFRQIEVKALGSRPGNKVINEARDPGRYGKWDELVARIHEAQNDPGADDASNHVVVQALRETLELRASKADVKTYAVDVLRVDRPGGVAEDQIATLAYAQERDAKMVEEHPYIAAFISTREERLSFAQWLRASIDAHELRFEVATGLDRFGLRRPVRGRLADPEAAASGDGTFKLILPPGTDLQWTSGFIRAHDADEDRGERERQSGALAALEEDRYRLELLREPAHVQVDVPRKQLPWQIELDGEPDASKQAAVTAALTSHPAFFLQGPPGTGKTTTAAEIVAQILAENGAVRILIAAQANEALDNLMEDVLKYLPHRERYLTLRVKSGRHVPTLPDIAARQPLAAVHELATKAAMRSQRRQQVVAEQDPDRAARAQPIITAWSALLAQRHSELERTLYRSANLVFATCSGSHALTQRYDVEKFDWVILEEAARAHATEMLVPLMIGQRWILIGDQAQLEPYKARDFAAAFRARVATRISAAAAKDDEDVTVALSEATQIDRSARFLALFQHLFHSAPASMRDTLTQCYRMHPTICEAVDRLFYRAPDADERVLNPGVSAEDRAHAFSADWAGEDWLSGRSLVWLDTSEHPGRREGRRIAGQTSIDNELELAVTDALLEQLRRQDPSRSIMLLSLYARQQSRLSEIADRHENTRALTVMSAQGKQADVVILNLVRSNTEESPGRSLGSIRNDRDLNVALSRARRLLILVGDLGHFERFGDRSGRFADLIALLRDWPEPETAGTAGVAPLTGLVGDDWDLGR